MKITERLILFVFCGLLYSFSALAQVNIKFDTKSAPVCHGVTTLRNVLENKGYTVGFFDSSSENGKENILIISDSLELHRSADTYDISTDKIVNEGYQIINFSDNKKIVIAAGDATGAMYGLQTLTDYFRINNDIYGISPVLENPLFEYRIIKFNLPWSPYRDSPATRIHMETCRDLHFWERFLDMMAENRFNVLSLWNLHPFPYMIRAKNFPEATPFNDQEISEWKSFWQQLFRMAKNRGIQTFIVNWNIVVSPEFAKAYGARQFNDTSELVRRYIRESVTQVINEYPDLTGIGVTLADWMNNFNGDMSARQRENWIEDTFVKGMQQADRKIKFLHRSVLAGSPIEMRRVINHAALAEPALVEIKFNWSHGHSTPTLAITHDYNSGKIDERFWTPRPRNYNIEWMIRNEDFFILRWGQPDFIRKHIEVNDHPYVNGYFVGSEGYIPALDYSRKISSKKTWQYGFEKQWLFYMLWGRLLYDPDTPDSVFENAFDLRYGKGTGHDLLQAYQLASDMPLKLASFHRSTWDYTLYSEGFLAPRPSDGETFYDDSSDFISVDELIYHETLDPSMISIQDYVKKKVSKEHIPGDMITPVELADTLERHGNQALKFVRNLENSPEFKWTSLQSELEDITTWSYLSLYFAQKLRGGIALQMYRKTGAVTKKDEAVDFLKEALNSWQKVVEHTKDRYAPVPYVAIPEDAKDITAFSWAYFLPQAQHDIDIALSSVPEKH